MNILRQDKKAEVEAHRINRAEQRTKTKSKKERSARTHKLCQIGGAVLSFYPDISLLSSEEIYELFEYLFTVPNNQLVTQRAIDNRSNKIKGNADG